MENLVKKLREALGLNQHKFADLIGRSFSSIQNYENGKHVPPDVMDRLRTIAAERGYADIAIQLSSDEWQVRRVFHPGETIIAAPVPPARSVGHYNPLNQKWHDMLEIILNSGDPDAIAAVQPNLLIFHAWVEERNLKLVRNDHQKPQAKKRGVR